MSQNVSDKISWLRQNAITGAIWLTLLSAVAIPLSYGRTWLLGRMSESGEVLGVFAALMIFCQAVFALAVPGGATVLTALIPKIREKRATSTFILSYAVLAICVGLLFVVSVLLVPNIERTVLRDAEMGEFERLLILVPILVASQVVVFALSGLMRFRLVAVLNQIQLIFTCVLAAVASVFFRGLFEANAWIFLVGTVAFAHLTVVVIGARSILKGLVRPDTRPYFPPGFWRFTGFVHLNTLCTFAYTSLDQLFVGAHLGAAELGAYFALLQCAMLIVFVPQRIGQVMLSSFAHLLALKSYDSLATAYIKICRAMLILVTPVALVLIYFSYELAVLFGEWFADRHLYLVLLSGALYIGALGSVSAMLVLSRERNGVYLANSLVMIAVQFGVTFWLIDNWGVYGVIAGKAAGIVSAQFGLFAILHWGLGEVRLGLPGEYLFGMLVVALSVGLVFHMHGSEWPIRGLLALGSLVAFFLLIRLRSSELMLVVREIRRPLSTGEPR